MRNLLRRMVAYATLRSPIIRLSRAEFDTAAGPPRLALAERLLEVLDQVVCRLDADGQPDEVRRRRERGVRGGRVRHLRGRFDQALDPAQALGQRPHARA